MPIKIIDFEKPTRLAAPGEIQRSMFCETPSPKLRELMVLPKHPTRAMIKAGAELFGGDYDQALRLYLRMVAAAPSLPIRDDYLSL